MTSEEFSQEQLVALDNLVDSLNVGLEEIANKKYNLRLTPARLAGPGFYAGMAGGKKHMKGGAKSCDDWKIKLAVNAFMVVIASGIGMAALIGYMNIFGLNVAMVSLFEAIYEIYNSIPIYSTLGGISKATISASGAAASTIGVAAINVPPVLYNFLKSLSILAPVVGVGRYYGTGISINDDLDKALSVVNKQIQELSDSGKRITRSISSKIEALQQRAKELKEKIIEKSKADPIPSSEGTLQDFIRKSHSNTRDFLCNLIDIIRDPIGVDELIKSINESELSGGKRTKRYKKNTKKHKKTNQKTKKRTKKTHKNKYKKRQIKK
jgi:hypothetical protein